MSENHTPDVSKKANFATMRLPNTITFLVLHADKDVLFTSRKVHFSRLNL